MKYLSVCSGIEAASVAWQPLGWEAVGFSEIEKFPSQVLAHHYPDVTNFGDMTKYKEWNLDTVNLLVGGTPCQSFSVAGLRKGLEDPRGNLALTYCGILDHFRPQWFVWENVPGVLSSGGGRDFGSFLGAVAELGYGFAYRVLDAQYFGVAQRRRRVFVVGYFGDWRPAAEVLFEPESLCRDNPPSREARQEVTQVAGTLTANGGGLNRPAGNANELDFCVATTFDRQSSGEYGTASVASTMAARDYKSPSDLVAEPMPINTMVALRHEALGRGTGFGLGEAGDPAYTLTKGHSHAVAQPIAFAQNQRDEVRIMQVAGALAAEPGMKQQTYLAQPIALAENTIGRLPQNGGNGDGFTEGGPMYTLNASGVHGVAQPVAYSFDSLASNSMKSSNPHSGCREVNLAKTLDTTTPEPSKNQGGIGIIQQMAVRRLTPVECERLQGFHDNYTDIKHNGKETPDGPRYKALGNSMAVPVMAWIGKRIAEYKNV